MSIPTVRRFPRSLAEAFPREHANPVEFFPAPFYRRLRWVPLFALCAFIGWLAAQGFPT